MERIILLHGHLCVRLSGMKHPDSIIFFSDSRRLNEIDRKQYAQLVNVDTGSAGGFQMSDAVLMGSLKTLSMLLEKCYGGKSNYLD